MNLELAYYVVKYYEKLMSDVERRANSHLLGTMKATMGRDDAAAQREAMQKPHYSKWLTEDPEVLKLASDGLQKFRVRTAARILEDHGEEVFLNYCPRCHELARTPTARQCRFCGDDWHTANPSA